MSTKESSKIRFNQFLSKLVKKRNLGTSKGGSNERAVYKNIVAGDRKAHIDQESDKAQLDEPTEIISHFRESLAKAY